MTNPHTAAGWITIRVPASSANLGPGYDSFGLALDRYDEIDARRIDHGLRITVDGAGASTVPTDATHLVFRAAKHTFDAVDEVPPGIEMRCRNTIPHSAGQGSSAAAIVAGVILARALGRADAGRLTDQDVFALATELEGHPDNVAPALFGGFTIAWTASGAQAGEGDPASVIGCRARAVRLAPHPAVRAMLLTADASCATSRARAALPGQVPHGDAAANSARAALLTHAMTADPTLLFDATEDRLHQQYRAAVMPRTAALLQRLRADGLAAVLSGAGPAVLVLGADLPDPAAVDAPGFSAAIVDIPEHGVILDGSPFGAPERTPVANPGAGPVA